MGERGTWVFPSDGSPAYKKGTRPDRDTPVRRGPTVMGDLPDFVSPVDGKIYSGRRGMREHNERNNVVPVEELKGLPYLQTNSDIRTAEQKRADATHRKEVLINAVNKYVR